MGNEFHSLCWTSRGSTSPLFPAVSSPLPSKASQRPPTARSSLPGHGVGPWASGLRGAGPCPRRVRSEGVVPAPLDGPPSPRGTVGVHRVPCREEAAGGARGAGQARGLQSRVCPPNRTSAASENRNRNVSRPQGLWPEVKGPAFGVCPWTPKTPQAAGVLWEHLGGGLELSEPPAEARSPSPPHRLRSAGKADTTESRKSGKGSQTWKSPPQTAAPPCRRWRPGHQRTLLGLA